MRPRYLKLIESAVLMTSAATTYAELEKAYLPRGVDHGSQLEVLAALDFGLRTVTMIAAATMRDRDPHQVNMGRAPGFGSYIAYTKMADSLLSASLRISEAHSRTKQLLVETLNAIQQFQGGSLGFGTLEKLRNHLGHGGSIPAGSTGEQLLGQSRQSFADISAAIHSFLSNAVVAEVPGHDVVLNRLTLQWSKSKLELWPFICSDQQGSWLFYAQFTAKAPEFLRPGASQVRVKGPGNSVALDLLSCLVPKSEDRTFPDFVASIKSDLDAFRDRDYEPHHYEDDGIVTFIWILAGGAGSEQRVDSFRIGANEERQWHSVSGSWLRYSAFLRDISNWSVVATRFRQRLQEIQRSLLEEEQAKLGWSTGSNFLIEPMVRTTDLEGAKLGPSVTFGKLMSEINERIQTRGPQTSIYFIEGDAGIGKTRVLVKTALERAEEVEAQCKNQNASDQPPLFLYLRSTGHAVSDLATVVAAAVSETQNLDERRVRVLSNDASLGDLGW